MNSVVKKKKKPLYAKIAERVTGEAFPRERNEPPPDVHFDDVRTDVDEMYAIEDRRVELMEEGRINADAKVYFNNGD